MKIKNLDIVPKLKKMGLSDKASLVYTTLLENGGAHPSKIAEITGLNRSTVYAVLLDLSVKGLVNEIEKGKKHYYQIERPEKLLRFSKHQIDNANDSYENAKKFMPEIEGLFQSLPQKPKITYYENIEGVRSIFEDYTDTKKKYELLGFANTTALETFVGEKFYRDFVEAKEKIGITTRGIIRDTDDAKTFPKRIFGHVKKEFWPNLRYVPKEAFPFNGEIIIYRENKVSITNYDKNSLVGIIIENQGVHDAMKAIFELAWKGAGKK